MPIGSDAVYNEFGLNMRELTLFVKLGKVSARSSVISTSPPSRKTEVLALAAIASRDAAIEGRAHFATLDELLDKALEIEDRP